MYYSKWIICCAVLAVFHHSMSDVPLVNSTCLSVTHRHQFVRSSDGTHCLNIRLNAHLCACVPTKHRVEI